MNAISQDRLYETVLVTGGAGYVGSALIPALLDEGYTVRVVDLFWYGRDVYPGYEHHPRLDLVELDIRNAEGMKAAMDGMDAVIHLACLSNDPSFELNPNLAKTINYDAFKGIREGAVSGGVQRFIYASSSSVYGVKDDPDVREDATPDPLTDYSKYKLACEHDLLDTAKDADMERVILRPATICGYAPRLRLDLTVNILTIHALVNHRIRIFGGKQLRPNINMQDMVRAYRMFLKAPGECVNNEIYNVGYQNKSVEDIALLVRNVLGEDVPLAYEPTDDMRSYHVNSDKIRNTLGFTAEHTIEEAIESLETAYREGMIHDPMNNTLYSNIKRMQELHVQ